MSGITGVVRFEAGLFEQKQALLRMIEALKQRGPDEANFYEAPQVFLGCAQLVIAESERGAQPMEKLHDGYSYALVLDGELYNGAELRKTLEGLGFVFTSASDAEVLLHAYIAWGTGCLKKLNGIFSFALWDARAETLLLCRDMLGVKPMFYAQKDDAFLFGSEIKALLAYPSMRARLGGEGVLELMGLGPARRQESGLLKGLCQLPAAHFLLFGKDGKRVERYWQLESKANEESMEETAEHIRALFIDAVKRRLPASVPVGTFLSGGLDSSAVSAVAAAEFEKDGRRLPTFSVDYKNNADFYKRSEFQHDEDEAWARLMSLHLNSRHSRVVLDNTELAAALFDAMRANDMPGMADIDASLLLFCREVKSKVGVALSGECADEIFGGYPWYARPELSHVGTFPWSGNLVERTELLNQHAKKLDLSGFVRQCYEATRAETPLSGLESEAAAEHKRLFYLNLKWFMFTLLTRKDRMSAHAGLAARVPFADIRLLEYAYNIPQEMLLYDKREKGLLRVAMGDLLPESVLWRKKTPYPKTFNPSYTGLVTSMLQAYLSDGDLRLLEFLDVGVVKELIETEGRSFTRPWYGQLMMGPQLIAYLVQLEAWLREYEVEIRL